MTDKLRVAVIGLGVGARHVRCYEAHGDCEVTTLCDCDPEQLRSVGEQHPGKRLVENAKEVLTDPAIDVVSIATFDDAHFEQVRMGIRHGKHILIEKPMCQTREQAVCIRQELNHNPHVRLSSNHVLRMSSRFQELRSRIQSGELGEVFYIEGDYQYGRMEKLTSGWRGKIDFYSVVQGGAIHLVDLLLWLLDDEIEEVSSMANRMASRGTGFRFDDTVVSLLKLKSGVIAKVSANFGCVRPHFHAVQVFGSKKTFVNAVGPAEVYDSTEKNSRPDLLETPYRDYQKPDLICSFIDWIQGCGEPMVSTDDAFNTMAACFSIEDAVAARKTIPFQKI